MKSFGTQRELVVLAYHKIGCTPDAEFDTWHFIPQSVFRTQLEWISKSEWEVIDLDTYISGMESQQTLPARSLLLTFDDGHLSMRSNAQPVLSEFGFPAVCFIPTDFIGRTSTFDAGVEPVEPICSWEDLRELETSGIAVQSHGASHYWFSKLDETQLEREIFESKQQLEQGLDRQVTAMAYPYSDAGDSQQIVEGLLRKADYLTAFLCGNRSHRRVLSAENPYFVDRLAVYRDTCLAEELA